MFNPRLALQVIDLMPGEWIAFADVDLWEPYDQNALASLIQLRRLQFGVIAPEEMNWSLIFDTKSGIVRPTAVSGSSGGY